MTLTYLELYERLPPDRDFWFAPDIAKALGVTVRTVQRTSKRIGIGRKLRHGPKGTYVFQPHDLQKLVDFIYGEVGNPVNIAKSRNKGV
jgi:hypothetical protein